MAAGKTVPKTFFLVFFKQKLLCFFLCRWGERKREAARRASSCFVGAVQEGLAAVRDVREVAGLLQRAVLAAHADIVRGYAADVFQAGTACLVGKNKEKNTHTLLFK